MDPNTTPTAPQTQAAPAPAQSAPTTGDPRADAFAVLRAALTGEDAVDTETTAEPTATPATPPAAAPQAQPDTAQAEPAPEPAPTEAPDYKRTAKELDALALAEARYRRERASLQQERQQFQTELAEAKRLRELAKLADTDPLEFLRQMRIDPNKLTAGVLAGTKRDPATTELEELRRKVTELETGIKTRTEEAAAAQRELVVRQAKAEMAGLVTPDKYPLCHAYGPDLVAEQAWQLAVQHHKRYGTAPTEAQLLTQLETALRDHGTRLAKALGYNPAPPPAAPTPPAPTPKPAPATITAAHGSRTVETEPEVEDTSPRARRAAAMAVIRAGS